MPRPQIHSVSKVLSALTTEPQTSTEISKKTGIPNATLNRKLTTLAKQGIVRIQGERRGTRYRLNTTNEELEKMSTQVLSNANLIRIEMSLGVAQVLQSATETLARLGNGQIEFMTDHLRWDDSLGINSIEEAETKVKLIKHDLIGSWSSGIRTTPRSPIPQKSWSIHRAIRHRLAWDRNPEGSFSSVSFDEPVLFNEKEAGFIVMSKKTEEGAKTITIQMSLDSVKVITIALETHKKLQSGDFSAAVDLARDKIILEQDGKPINKHSLERYYAIAKEVGLGLGFESPLKNRDTIICAGLLNAIEDRSGKLIRIDEDSIQEVFSLSTVTPESQPLSFSSEDLPPGYTVLYQRNEFNVIGPCEDPDHLMIIAQSHSPQTAILKARNIIRRGRTPPI